MLNFSTFRFFCFINAVFCLVSKIMSVYNFLDLKLSDENMLKVWQKCQNVNTLNISLFLTFSVLKTGCKLTLIGE